MKNSPSQYTTVDLKPTFGGDVGRFRYDQVSWFDDMCGMCDHIFTLATPLELVDTTVIESSDNNDIQRPTLSSLTFALTGDSSIRGITPDQYVLDILRQGGEVLTSVDSLSRSVHFAEGVNETPLMALQSRSEADTEWFSSDRDFGMNFDRELTNEEVVQATELLTCNVKSHERNHFKLLIDPETALWRELDLYWHSILLMSNPKTWLDSDFLDEFTTLYMTPNRFITEWFAIEMENYTTDSQTVQQAVETYVATQRGAESDLLDFVKQQDIDSDAFSAKLRSSVGEQYCDLWLAYIVDRLRAGYPLDEITATNFRRRLDETLSMSDSSLRALDARDAVVDFIHTSCYGPVVELVEFASDGDGIRLEQSWYSLNPRVSGKDNILGVRRSLYRRYMLSCLQENSEIDEFLGRQETAVEKVICGTSLADTQLFDPVYSSTSNLKECLRTTHANATDALLGETMTTGDLDGWLCDPNYGFSGTMD